MTVRREVRTAKPRAPATRAELRKRVDERRRVAASIFHTTLSWSVFFVSRRCVWRVGWCEGLMVGESGAKEGGFSKKNTRKMINDDAATCDFWAPLQIKILQ